MTPAFYFVGRVPVAATCDGRGEVVRLLAYNPLKGGFTSDPCYVIKITEGDVRPSDRAAYEARVRELQDTYGLPVQPVPWDRLTPPPADPAPTQTPTPTLDALAQRFTGGNRDTIIRLLDALDTATLRQARTERHAAGGTR